MLGHYLPAGAACAAPGGEAVAIVAAQRPLELRPDEENTLGRGGQLNEFS